MTARDVTKAGDVSPAAHLRRIAWPMPLGALAAVACWWAAGQTLGLYLGVLFMVALLSPVMAAGEVGAGAGRFFPTLMSGGAVVDGAAIVLLGTVATGTLGIGQWLLLYVLLVSWAAALVGLVHLGGRLGRWVAMGVTVLLAMAWLTWPVWLSPILTEGMVKVLVPCHPLFALNGAVQHLGLWSEQAGVVYHHTSLNQDFPYALPTTIWPAVVLHLLVCVGGVLPRWWGQAEAQPEA